MTLLQYVAEALRLSAKNVSQVWAAAKQDKESDPMHIDCNVKYGIFFYIHLDPLCVIFINNAIDSS